jgi:hypothetical protein
MSDQPLRPRFCPNCGAALPADPARFCIECGTAIRGAPAIIEDEPPDSAPSFQLPNARAPQQVIGGTVKLPDSGAVPPGLWVRDQPPGPADVVAIYPPLRPVRGGWSGLVGRGWRAAGSEDRRERTIFHFRAEVPWFPAPGCGGGLSLITEVAASSQTWDGRGRRGFRFGVSRDGPMGIVRALWQDAEGRALEDRPLPQIQIMAPPRVARVSDLEETPGLLDAREAALWAGDSQAAGAYRLLRDEVIQEHTPVGRGITLIPLRGGREGPLPWWGRLLPGVQPARYRARVLRPFSCTMDEWPAHLEAIGAEARALGLDLDPALAAEWWLDRHGHDGVIFSAARARYQAERVLIVFRRAQLTRIKD